MLAKQTWQVSGLGFQNGLLSLIFTDDKLITIINAIFLVIVVITTQLITLKYFH